MASPGNRKILRYLANGLSKPRLRSERMRALGRRVNSLPILLIAAAGTTLSCTAWVVWGSWNMLTMGLATTLLVAAYVKNVSDHAITLRRQVYQRMCQLRESRRQMRVIAQSTQDAVVVMDASGNAVFWNAAATRIFGYSSAEAVGKKIHEIIAPSRYRPEYSAGLKKFWETGTGAALGRTVELQGVRKDGVEVPIELSLSTAMVNDQRYAIAVVRDITERKQVEKQILQEEATAKILLKMSQMADRPASEVADYALNNVIQTTGSTIGYIAFVNEDETVLTLHYWSNEAMRECAVANKPLACPLEATGIWGEAIRQRRPIVTNDYAAPNPLKKGLPEGHIPLVRHANVPVFDGEKIVAVVGVANKPDDYTDADIRQLQLLMDGMWRILCRKRAEESLHESEERLRAMIANLPGTVYQFYVRPNGEMGIYHLDGKYHDLFSPSDPTQPLYQKIIELLDPRDLPRFLESNMRSIQEVEPWDFEGRFILPGGEVRWFRGISSPSRRENEIVFNGMALDITERKKAEEELRHYMEALEEANRNLEQAKLAAESATRAKSEFLANTSHEIRTPLTAILGYAEILVENAQDAAAAEAADTIQRNGRYLLDIINNILDISKIEAGKLSVEWLDCSPVALVAEIASLMRVRADAKNLALTVEFDGPVPQTIRTDPLRLRQILINLVGNAVKFTEHGSVRIVTRLRCEEESPPALEFDIVDTGIGMTESQLARLYQPFTQADASTNRQFGGSGLGLSISRRLAELLHGDIRVRSEPGRGSTFTVTLDPGPLDHVSMVANATEAVLGYRRREQRRAQELPKLSGHVLLVEDGPDNQRLIAFILRKAGARVTIAENGQAAIERITALTRCLDEGVVDETGPFGVVLMDMQMPVLDGYETTRQLRSMGYDGPIVALTAHAMSQDRKKCLDVGCDDYLSKPIERRTLLETVARHLAAVGSSGVEVGNY